MRSNTLKLLGISAAAIVALSANPALARHHHHHHHYHGGHHRGGHYGRTHGGKAAGKHSYSNIDCPKNNPNCHVDPHPHVP